MKAKLNKSYSKNKKCECGKLITNTAKYCLSCKQKWRRQDQLHPTQKPVALFEYLIKTYTNEEDLVLDNCMGSGTTGVACKLLNRRFIGIERSKKYLKIAQERIKNTIKRNE